MTLRRKLALRYAVIVAVCLALLGGLARHEFIIEPAARKALGIPDLPETLWGEYAEVFFYGMIPLVLGAGYWFMRRTLLPIDTLARRVERIRTDNLREPLPRTYKGDEVDRLTKVFNAMTARLDQSFQQIREFTLHASHELKTPLTVMRAQLDTKFGELNALSPAQREWLHNLQDEVRRLTRIVDTLTLLTKADAGQVTLEQEPVRLDQLVRESFEDALILAEPHQVQVTLAGCDAATVLGDRARLRQLLLNLTDNAVKYNQPGGNVNISLRAADEQAELQITNTGEGLPPELQARVFERFVRGNTARSRGIEGSGLGLAICQWIVQSHRGTIAIASQPGQTTTVTVRLPLASSPLPAGMAQP